MLLQELVVVDVGGCLSGRLGVLKGGYERLEVLGV